MSNGPGLKAYRDAPAAARLQRLMRAARAAHVSNPRNAGLYAGSVTITDNGATLPAATSLSYPFVPGSPGVWATNGGTPVVVNSTSRFTSAVIATTGGTVGLNNGKTANWWRASVMMDARYLAIRVSSTSAAYRILVDGRYVSLAGTLLATTSSSTPQYLLYDFGVRGLRRITIEGQLACGFAGGYVEPTGTLYPLEMNDAVYGAVLLDSYAVGSAAAALGDGVFPVMGDWLGATMHVSGSSGTGWATTTNYRFDERIANGDLALGGVTPDFIVTGASINDRARDPATVQANAATGLAAIRAQYSGVPIVVLGCAAGATGPTSGSPSVLTSENALQAAMGGLADRLMGFVPVSFAATGAIVSGTGKVGTTTGTGNSDWATASDGIHPTDEGCALLGRFYAAAVLKTIARMGP